MFVILSVTSVTSVKVKDKIVLTAIHINYIMTDMTDNIHTTVTNIG